MAIKVANTTVISDTRALENIASAAIAGNVTIGGTATVTGAITGSISGNADTATKLQTARTIGGVSFDGSANINLPGVNAAGTQNTTGTAANVTGTIAIANGGTGATTAAAARTNLGAGTVTSVGGTGTVGGITLSGTVTGSGNLTLSGTVLPTFSNDATINGITFGRGSGNSSTNTASGRTALNANTTGTSNTANGELALSSNTSGNSNTANGNGALRLNNSGSDNTAIGVNVLEYNTTGGVNVAIGNRSLRLNTNGVRNTCIGYDAGYFINGGSDNVGIGFNALKNVTTGSRNTAINPTRNPVDGPDTYSPVFDPTTQSDRFCMGSTSVTNAYINVAWTIVSDARDKTDFKSIPLGLDFISKLNPISFRYKINRDLEEGHGPIRYGFKAQEVLELEKDNPVIVDNETPDKLRIIDSNLLAVLVKAVQELKLQVDSLKSIN